MGIGFTCVSMKFKRTPLLQMRPDLRQFCASVNSSNEGHIPLGDLPGNLEDPHRISGDAPLTHLLVHNRTEQNVCIPAC